MGKTSRTKNAVRASLAGGAMIAGFFAYTAVAAQAQSGNAATVYQATLSALPNTSGQGQATLRLSGGKQKNLQIHITASGLDAGGAHLSHVHGLPDGAESSCPTSAQDTDGDGFVELAEGAVTYGPIIIDFMDIDPNQDGVIDFRTTVKLTGDNAGALPLENRHIVIHGMSVPEGAGEGTDGEVDGSGGYKVLLPVLCGEIVQQSRNGDALEFRSPRG